MPGRRPGRNGRERYSLLKNDGRYYGLNPRKALYSHFLTRGIFPPIYTQKRAKNDAERGWGVWMKSRGYISSSWRRSCVQTAN